MNIYKKRNIFIELEIKLNETRKKDSQNNNKLMLDDNDLVYISHMRVQFNVFDIKKAFFMHFNTVKKYVQ